MIVTNRRRCAGSILCLALILIVASLTVSAVENDGIQIDEELDSITNGFVNLVETLDDICTTVTEVPAVGSKTLLSGRIMFGKEANMLSFEIRNNPILEGFTMIIDNQEQVMYLLSPSSDQALRMTVEIAAAQLTALGIGDGQAESLMAGFTQLLPVDILSNFRLEPLRLAERDDKTYCLIKLTPMDEAEAEANPEDYGIIWIDPVTYHLCRLEQFHGDKSTGEFVLTDSSYNTGLARSDFFASLQGKSIEDYY